MSYFQQPYCVTNFIVFDDYKLTSFRASDFEGHSYHNVMKSNVNYGAFGERKDEMSLVGKTKTVRANEESIIDYLARRKSHFFYNPLEDTKELYLELFKVKVYDDKSLIKFVKSYGLPYHEFLDDEINGIHNSDLFPNKPNERAFIGMDTLTFYEKLIRFQGMVKLWNNIKDNNIKYLERVRLMFEASVNEADTYLSMLSTEEYIQLALQQTRVADEQLVNRIVKEFDNNNNDINSISTAASEHARMWEVVKDSSLQDIAKAELSLRLNMVDSGHPTTMFKNGMTVPGIRFNNLMEVAYYQLSQAIFKDMAFEKCLNCGDVFEPVHARQKFCPPLPKRKRSTCENTYNQRLKRQRQKEKQKTK